MTRSRLPLQPLNDFIQPRLHQQYERHMQRTDRQQVPPFESCQTELIAQVCGVSRKSVQRWNERQYLRLSTAEDVADAMGVMASAIWGDAYHELALNRRPTRTPRKHLADMTT